ncbi:fibulin-7-like isoform X1 [Takifugu rubripes]|nr:fibulin-7-like isoform X1 [Takifugu rubripes]
MCLQTQRWSGQQPECHRTCPYRILKPVWVLTSNTIFPHSGRNNTRASTTPSSLALPSSSSPPPSSPSIRPSRCSHLWGHTISGHNNICTDIDECRVLLLGQPGRLCVHHCVNSPGSFSCFCPAGYDRDGSSCTDVNECETQIHNCSTQHMCVNTFGGFQCVTVSCPSRKNATYIKTSPVCCEKNPCMQGDKGCLQTPNSISFHFLSVVSNMSAPRVLFQVSAARVLGDTLRFGLAGGSGHGHFSVQRSGRQTGTLLLVTPIRGPTTL